MLLSCILQEPPVTISRQLSNHLFCDKITREFFNQYLVSWQRLILFLLIPSFSVWKILNHQNFGLLHSKKMRYSDQEIFKVSQDLIAMENTLKKLYNTAFLTVWNHWYLVSHPTLSQSYNIMASYFIIYIYIHFFLFLSSDVLRNLQTQ